MSVTTNDQADSKEVQAATRRPILRRARLLWLLPSLATLFLAIAAVAAAYCWLELNQPYRDYEAPELVLTVPSGQTIKGTAQQLEESGVIKSSRLFEIFFRFYRREQQLQAGEYRFEGNLSLFDVVEKLKNGDIHHYRVTVPEGLDRVEIAQVFVSAGFGSLERFLVLMNDPAPILDLNPEAETLEGFLHPNTYFLPSGSDEKAIVDLMLSTFRRLWTDDLSQRAAGIGLSISEIVTLASLIEKETGKPEERSLVSAVFHNRLKIGMKLACDPTVIYAVKRVKEYDGIIHRSDLQLDSPYNTYLYPGLPPGPIANPGQASILAALNPADSDYLFFVSRNDGSHIFSTNYRDHSRAVQRYQR